MTQNAFYPKYHCSKITQWYKSDLPKTLQPYVNYEFSSGGTTGEDFKSFDRKYKNAINKMLPEGYSIVRWSPNHYCGSATIQDDKGRLIYLSYSDVRYFDTDWICGILIRTMAHEKDWTGGHNNYTDLVNFTENIQRLYPQEG